MRREIIKTGKTVEEAINSACAELGCERDNCEWEIIDLPKRGFLGLKNTPAKVKVSIEIPESKPAIKAAAPAIGNIPDPKNREQQARPEPHQNTVTERPYSSGTQQKKPMPEKKPEPQRENRPAAARQPAPQSNNFIPSEEFKAKAKTAAGYLTNILVQIDLPGASVEPVWEDNGLCLRIVGDGLGLIIGRRGDTLDALQYLCGLVANRLDGEYLRVTVDCGDYRVKRRQTLETLARKLSEQVLKTETSRSLEPMNPFERRVIHATVSTIEGVSSTSVGEEPNRRVVITCPGAKRARPSFGKDRPSFSKERAPERERPAPRNDREGSSSPRAPIADRPSWPDKGAKGDRPDERERRPPHGRSRGDRDNRRQGRDRPPAYQPVKEPDHPPTEADNKPLYGKIDLE